TACCAHSSDMCLYADDIAVFPLRGGQTGELCLSAALDRITQWSNMWRVRFSADKSQCVYFHNNRAGRSPARALHVDGFSLQYVHSYTYLGIVLQSDARWNLHMERVTSRCMHSIYLLSRFMLPRHCVSLSFIRSLINSVVLSRLSYGMPLWCPS